MNARAYAFVLTAFIAALPCTCAGEPVRVARTSLGIRPPPPELVRFMRQAHQVFIFPNPTPRHPRRDAKRMRLLSPKARRDLIRLVGHHDHWFLGGDGRIEIGPPPKDIGLLFRRGSDELELFFYPGELIDARFNGRLQRSTWSPGGKYYERMEAWKARYAQPELSAK